MHTNTVILLSLIIVTITTAVHLFSSLFKAEAVVSTLFHICILNLWKMENSFASTGSCISYEGKSPRSKHWESLHNST